MHSVCSPPAAAPGGPPGLPPGVLAWRGTWASECRRRIHPDPCVPTAHTMDETWGGPSSFLLSVLRVAETGAIR